VAARQRLVVERSPPAEDLRETPLDRGQAEETNMRSRIKLGGEVDVAHRIRLAARRRAEQR
jgi:hypothetical protein